MTESPLDVAGQLAIDALVNYREVVTANDAAQKGRIEELEKQVTPVVLFKWGLTYKDNTDPADLEARIDSTVTCTRKFRQMSEATTTAILGQIKSDGNAGRKNTIVSIKVNDTWANVAKGTRDTELKSMATRIQETAAQFNMTVYMAANHEPENDDNISDTQRDNWRNMQSHLADIFSNKNVKFGVILMGYHSMPAIASSGGRWLLENCVPDNVEFVFFDYYEKRGRNKKGTTTEDTGRTDWNTVFGVLRDYCQERNMEYGLAETGISKRGFTAIPDWFEYVYLQSVHYGATVFAYFNTLNNDGQPGTETQWLMDSAREQAFGAVLKKVHNG